MAPETPAGLRALECRGQVAHAVLRHPAAGAPGSARVAAPLGGVVFRHAADGGTLK